MQGLSSVKNMLRYLVSDAKHISKSAWTGINKIPEHLYEDVLSLKEHLENITPKDWVYSENSIDSSLIIITLVPSMIYAISPSDSAIEALKIGMIAYALATPFRINDALENSKDKNSRATKNEINAE